MGKSHSCHIVAAIAATILGCAGGLKHAQAAAPSAKDFARYAQIENVSVSPDGKHIAGLISPDGQSRYVAVWETSDPEKKPFILGAQHMQLLSVEFVKNDRLGVVAQQLFTAGQFKGHLRKLYLTDLKGTKWTSALPEGRARSESEEFAQKVSSPRILSALQGDPSHILVLNAGLDGAGDVYKVDIYSGEAERIARGSDTFGSLQVDSKGEIRARQEINFDNGKVYLAQWIKSPAGVWEEHFRSYAKDRNITSVVGFTTDPNLIYVSARRNSDKIGVYEYDIGQRKILEPAFEHKLFDADSVLQHRATGQLLGFGYFADTPRIYWTDEKLAVIAKGLPTALGLKTTSVNWVDPASGQTATVTYPDGAGARIVSLSQDFKQVVVEKSGPNQPPEYYLLADGTKLTLLGRSRPQIDGKALGESRMIEYKARDGLMIPAFLHTPPKSLFGDGPYPAIVLPHGGPSARDELDWDVSGWTKYFTARGYVVIQPQFRGSEGWGSKLARAGDAQWGLAMQDDNDDAAKWLISQKLAAPDRIALFGYSYGGYAAFAAAIRPNGLYQCSIAGAGVAEIKRFQGETYDDRFLREYQRPTIDGLDPLPNARKVSIPIFVYHGDRDQTVEVEESRRFVAELKAANKPHKYLEIKDMGHQYILMTPEMLELQLTEIEKYLKNDCKPGGV